MNWLLLDAGLVSQSKRVQGESSEMSPVEGAR